MNLYPDLCSERFLLFLFYGLVVVWIRNDATPVGLHRSRIRGRHRISLSRVRSELVEPLTLGRVANFSRAVRVVSDAAEKL